MAGTFGDIIALDPQTKQKYRITNDRFYDANASWFPDGKKIIFESRRTDCRICDMSAPSRLFTVEVPSLRVSQFDKDFDKRFSIVNEDGNEDPVVNHDGTEVAFFTRQRHLSPSLDPYFSLVIYNMIKDTIDLVEDSLKGPYSLHWANDDRYLTFSEDLFLDLFPKEKTVVAIDRMRRQRVVNIRRENWRYDAVGFYKDNVIYSGYEFKKYSPVIIFEHSLGAPQSRQLYSFQDWYPDEFVFIDSNRICAHVIQSDKSEIGIINLATGKLELLTTDGHQKQGLSYLDRIR